MAAYSASQDTFHQTQPDLVYLQAVIEKWLATNLA